MSSSRGLQRSGRARSLARSFWFLVLGFLTMGSKSYRDLVVWQKAVAVVTDVYRLTETFPSSELYGLTSQVRRAAVSVAANIAEGQGRNSTKDFLKFLSNARGSLYEVETHMVIARNLGYVAGGNAESICAKFDEVERLLAGLIRALAVRASDEERPPDEVSVEEMMTASSKNKKLKTKNLSAHA